MDYFNNSRIKINIKANVGKKTVRLFAFGLLLANMLNSLVQEKSVIIKFER